MSGGPRADDGEGEGETPTELSDLFDELEELEDLVQSPEAREQVRETMRVALDVETNTVFGQVIRGYDRGDLAESLLGALVFGIPMFVEGGTRSARSYSRIPPFSLQLTQSR